MLPHACVFPDTVQRLVWMLIWPLIHPRSCTNGNDQFEFLVCPTCEMNYNNGRWGVQLLGLSTYTCVMDHSPWPDAPEWLFSAGLLPLPLCNSQRCCPPAGLTPNLCSASTLQTRWTQHHSHLCVLGISPEFQPHHDGRISKCLLKNSFTTVF